MKFQKVQEHVFIAVHIDGSPASPKTK